MEFFFTSLLHIKLDNKNLSGYSSPDSQSMVSKRIFKYLFPILYPIMPESKFKLALPILTAHAR
jgi:hypothetical protein